MDNRLATLIIILSLGQIIGLIAMVEMIVKKRSRTYQAWLFIIVGTFPIIKVLLPLAGISGIIAACIGVLFILTGLAFLWIVDEESI